MGTSTTIQLCHKNTTMWFPVNKMSWHETSLPFAGEQTRSGLTVRSHSKSGQVSRKSKLSGTKCVSSSSSWELWTSANALLHPLPHTHIPKWICSKNRQTFPYIGLGKEMNNKCLNSLLRPPSLWYTQRHKCMVSSQPGALQQEDLQGAMEDHRTAEWIYGSSPPWWRWAVSWPYKVGQKFL